MNESLSQQEVSESKTYNDRKCSESTSPEDSP